jgi:hypothetical protein
MSKLYRVVSAPGDVPPPDTHRGRLSAQVPAARPEHPASYEGAWVCPNVLCPVRVVCLRVKSCHPAHLPRLRCPLCHRALDFWHWVATIHLQEVAAVEYDILHGSSPPCHTMETG